MLKWYFHTLCWMNTLLKLIAPVSFCFFTVATRSINVTHEPHIRSPWTAVPWTTQQSKSKGWSWQWTPKGGVTPAHTSQNLFGSFLLVHTWWQWHWGSVGQAAAWCCETFTPGSSRNWSSMQGKLRPFTWAKLCWQHQEESLTKSIS
jgi:hypothetical protein